ncbi:MAG: hypothetical protein JWL76_1013 [Thermoleophilia bacterium]|nr:hypothetical protein [Thermoleophilia bacterium]
MPATEPTSTPALPDRYTDLRRIARGGMGEVWHARDSRLERDVAIKLVATGDGLEDDAIRRTRFEREARVVARLSTHPNVVTIYDVGEVDDRPYLAMEWMDGGTLAEQLQSPTPPPTDELLDTLERVASALDAAHADGIVHRDVKPGNVLFDAHGTPRIGDFGIATFAADPAMSLTQAGAVIGTSGYIAPEQANGDGAVAASDQYALMVIAFEALTGARPFARDSIVAELAAHVSEPVPSAPGRAPHLPPEVDDVFERALAKDPVTRFPTCSAAVAALRHALDHPAPTRVTPAAAAVTERLSTVRARLPRSVPGLAPRPSPVMPRMRRRIAIAAGLIMVGILALLAAGAFGDDPTARKQSGATTTDTGTSATTTAKTATTDTTPAPEPAPEPKPEPAVTPEPAPTPAPEPTAAERRAAAIEQQEQSFAALQAGRFQEAYDLGIDALQDLGGVAPWEAYANYNVGAALIGLGRCDESFAYLDRSEQLQRHRDEIDAARAAATQCVEGAAPANGNGNGNGKDKGKKRG